MEEADDLHEDLYDDLYEDVGGGQQIPKSSLQEFEDRIEVLKKKEEDLHAIVEALQKEKEALQQDKAVLVRNMSCLFKTAQMELARKEKQMKELRDENMRLKMSVPHSNPRSVNNGRTVSGILTGNAICRRDFVANANMMTEQNMPDQNKHPVEIPQSVETPHRVPWHPDEKTDFRLQGCQRDRGRLEVKPNHLLEEEKMENTTEKAAVGLPTKYSLGNERGRSNGTKDLTRGEFPSSSSHESWRGTSRLEDKPRCSDDGNSERSKSRNLGEHTGGDRYSRYNERSESRSEMSMHARSRSNSNFKEIARDGEEVKMSRQRR